MVSNFINSSPGYLTCLLAIFFWILTELKLWVVFGILKDRYLLKFIRVYEFYWWFRKLWVFLLIRGFSLCISKWLMKPIDSSSCSDMILSEICFNLRMSNVESPSLRSPRKDVISIGDAIKLLWSFKPLLLSYSFKRSSLRSLPLSINYSFFICISDSMSPSGPMPPFAFSLLSIYSRILSWLA